jgi:putative tryptophan/tyrosine transport system substrate-binding protein
MRRRDVLSLIGAAAAWPLAAHAQQDEPKRRIGVFNPTEEGGPLTRTRDAALTKGLDALGWKEGGNVIIDRRWARSDPALFARYADELVALAPDVIFAAGSSCVEALRRRTRTIPIVFAVVSDPVGQGFVASLARPGGNTTGFTDFDAPMVGKWLEMLARITPPVSHVAVLYNPATAPYAGLMLRAINDVLPSLGLTARAAPVHDQTEIEAAMTDLSRVEHGGVLVLPDSFTVLNRPAIVASIARARLPAVYWNRAFTLDGGLMSYGVDNTDLYARSADYIDRILRGAKSSDLPVQNPTKFDLVINLKTAAALGVSIPPSLLAAADEVIE